jgi:hypothetical protein
MSSIGLTTLGMFDGPRNYISGGVIVKEEKETIPKPNIFVKDVEFKKSLYENIQEDFIVVKSVK